MLHAELRQRRNGSKDGVCDLVNLQIFVSTAGKFFLKSLIFVFYELI